MASASSMEEAVLAVGYPGGEFSNCLAAPLSDYGMTRMIRLTPKYPPKGLDPFDLDSTLYSRFLAESVQIL